MKSLLADVGAIGIAFYTIDKSDPVLISLPRHVQIHAVKDYISDLEKEIEEFEKEFADL